MEISYKNITTTFWPKKRQEWWQMVADLNSEQKPGLFSTCFMGYVPEAACDNILTLHIKCIHIGSNN